MCNVFTVFKLHATEEDGRMGRLINHSRQAPNLIPKQLKLSGTVYWSVYGVHIVIVSVIVPRIHLQGARVWNDHH